MLAGDIVLHLLTFASHAYGERLTGSGVHHLTSSYFLLLVKRRWGINKYVVEPDGDVESALGTSGTPRRTSLSFTLQPSRRLTFRSIRQETKAQ